MYQVGGTCFNTKAQALSAKASAESGKVLEHAGQAHLVVVSGVSETSVTYSLQPLAGGMATVLEVPQDPQPCQLLTMADVSPILAAITLGLLSVYGIMILWRARIGVSDD
ncbi:hypothetical protein [Comamonas aquatica]|uniref:hypothetical protein n=1 Tax=Comamonas aquatica TaxID=225991 RepID=UPI0031D6CF13